MRRPAHLTFNQLMQKRKSLQPFPTDLPKDLLQPSISPLLQNNPILQQQPTYQIVDNLINMAKNGTAIVREDKMSIINVIDEKLGRRFNGELMSDRISLKFYNRVVELQVGQKERNMFVLAGCIQIYGLKPVTGQTMDNFSTQPSKNLRRRKYTNISQQRQQAQFQTIDEYQIKRKQYEVVDQIKEFYAIGPLFNNSTNQNERKTKVVAVNAVVIEIEKCDLDEERIFTSDLVSGEQKILMLQNFGILQSLGKRILYFVPHFKLKEYRLKQYLYKVEEDPKKVYFIVNGQISFETIINSNQGQKDNQKIHINTETISQNSYFGEEEIIQKKLRSQTAKCVTEKSVVLEIEKDKFLKMLDYREFYEIIEIAANAKGLKRKNKIEKIQKMIIDGILKQNGQKVKPISQEEMKMITSNTKEDKNKSSIQRKRVSSENNVKVMHGHVLKQFSNKKSPKIEFSMLEVNPDMYESTLKKYRKYSVQPYKYIPDLKLNVKKVWKVLNLQNILRQQEMEITSPQGRKFYDSHRRIRHQINECKSIRPKTTSSSYRTKLQYINYLQQFQN